MVVIDGQPVPTSKKLGQLTGKIEKLEAELGEGAWATKRKALERTAAQRDSKREAFAREHRAGLLVELEAADDAATEAMRAALASVLDALEHRQDVAADLDAVLRYVPPLYEGSNAHPRARMHGSESGLRNEIRERLRVLSPTMPPELLGGTPGAGDPNPERVEAGRRARATRARRRATTSERGLPVVRHLAGGPPPRRPLLRERLPPGALPLPAPARRRARGALSVPLRPGSRDGPAAAGKAVTQTPRRNV